MTTEPFPLFSSPMPPQPAMFGLRSAPKPPGSVAPSPTPPPATRSKPSINGLKSARYQVFAMKEADGYANPRWFIYDNGTVPVVQLSDAAPASDVRVKIGPKAARISGTITDAATGDPIEAVSFRVWRGSNCASALSLGATPKYDLLVPSGAEIALEVSVPGYEVWRYNHGP